MLVKGGDYAREEVVGRDTVEALGGEVILIDLVPGHSTSAMVERARGPEDAIAPPRINSALRAQLSRCQQTLDTWFKMKEAAINGGRFFTALGPHDPRYACKSPFFCRYSSRLTSPRA